MDAAPAYHGGPFRMRPGILLRRLLEAISAGILILPGGVESLRDPSTIAHTLPFHEARFIPANEEPLIEACMSLEDREKATFAAQTCLRLVTFRQIYKVGGAFV